MDVLRGIYGLSDPRLIETVGAALLSQSRHPHPLLMADFVHDISYYTFEKLI